MNNDFEAIIQVKNMEKGPFETDHNVQKGNVNFSKTYNSFGCLDLSNI